MVPESRKNHVKVRDKYKLKLSVPFNCTKLPAHNINSLHRLQLRLR